MENTSKCYAHLHAEDRVTIASLKQQSYGIRAMARVLQRSPSTISRELRRNGEADGYTGIRAQQSCRHRRRQSCPQPKHHADGLMLGVVQHFLHLRWSPEQIALVLSNLYPKGHEHRVSHETIYNCIYTSHGHIFGFTSGRC